MISTIVRYASAYSGLRLIQREDAFSNCVAGKKTILKRNVRAVY